MVNPADPLYGDIKLDLEEELRIGRDHDEQTQIYRVQEIIVDTQATSISST